jgi:2',3'-cyclic-nucleotide 2'-phosphodiesterase/3'-nucleotidase
MSATEIRRRFLLRALLFTGILTATASFVEMSAARRSPAPTPKAESVSITLLGTTDLHGRIEPWDYYSGKPVDLGLVKIATLVKQARAEAPDALLFDSGDMVQDPESLLTNYFLNKKSSELNPMIAAMNQLRYDAMAVGNHEFNFAPQPMWKIKGESKFPWLCANIKQTYTEGAPYFPPYIIKKVKGVRVGIVAFVTTVAPPSEGYTFEPILTAAKRVIPELRSQADLVVVLLHSGFVSDPTGGPSTRIQVESENLAPDLAEQVPGIDVILFGHTHSELPEKFINGVLLTEAKYWGMSLARADVAMTKSANGRWEVTSKHSHTIPVTADVPSDPEIAAVVKPYRQELDQYLDTPIAAATKPLSGRHARYEDSPLLDVIQETQLDEGHADVSMANLLNDGVKITPGPVTVRQVGALYPAANNIAVMELTGAQLKDALEHSASFFPQWPPPSGTAIALPSFNPDQAGGVSYEIDLTKPAGDRIRNLQFHGKPLDPAQKVRVAVASSHRVGEGGYAVYKGLPVVARTSDMQELLIDHVTRTKKLSAEAAGNWKIVPAEAVAAMEKASDASAASQTK